MKYISFGTFAGKIQLCAVHNARDDRKSVYHTCCIIDGRQVAALFLGGWESVRSPRKRRRSDGPLTPHGLQFTSSHRHCRRYRRVVRRRVCAFVVRLPSRWACVVVRFINSARIRVWCVCARVTPTVLCVCVKRTFRRVCVCERAYVFSTDRGGARDVFVRINLFQLRSVNLRIVSSPTRRVVHRPRSTIVPKR